MLEDDFTYVLRKALLGHSLSPADAALRAGLSFEEVDDFLSGSFSVETALALAAMLGLNAEAYSQHDLYQPRPMVAPGIERLDLPFGPERVNAWLASYGDDVILFDAGYEESDLMVAVETRCGRLPDRVFLTHAHRDHIGGLDHLVRSGVPVHGAGIPGSISMNPGESICCGSLRIHACDLSGHAVPGLGFHIAGLSLPVLVTGDALFAGSMGGCNTPQRYRQALECLHHVLDGLPAATVLLPGHGPATTLGEERVSNPFL